VKPDADRVGFEIALVNDEQGCGFHLLGALDSPLNLSGEG
jgi:hypothetical protein